ncbi:MAG TPA: right-handed parallel beta-helix repeat-containing protein [Planctomycetota bacterium]|nr:right-handed parallel beta-helix repeat-containing protein [Planctomycetota bacterium]
MRTALTTTLVLALCQFASAATLIIEGPLDRGEDPLPVSQGTFTIEVWAEGIPDFNGVALALKFVDVNGQESNAFGIDYDYPEGNPLFFYYAIQPAFSPEDGDGDVLRAGFSTSTPQNASGNTLLMTISMHYPEGGNTPSGLFRVDLVPCQTGLSTASHESIPFDVIPGWLTIDRGALYVDDDGPYDPEPGVSGELRDPDLCDPLEDGSPEHPFDSVQKAIDAAEDGDIIIVLDSLTGGYVGLGNRDITFRGKAIFVTSENGSSTCVVNAGSETGHRCFLFNSGEGPSSVLSGFTITGGCTESGGGCYINGCSPTLIGNLITGNSAARYGGGIYCTNNNASPTIVDNEISLNTADFGAGVAAYWGNISPLIAGSTIHDNDCSSGGKGGGLYVFSMVWCSPQIVTCAIVANRAQQGGGLFVVGTLASLTRNRLAANEALEGGGIYFSAFQGKIHSNFFNGNIAGEGGAIYCIQALPTLVSNNTFVSSKSLLGSAGGVFADAGSKRDPCPPLKIINSIFWNNGIDFKGCSVTYSRYSGAEEGVNGNTARAPHFVDPLDPEEPDFHLMSYSPLINRGQNSNAVSGSCDIDGDSRILFSQVDMGADEAYSVSDDLEEPNGDGLPDAWENATFGDTAHGPDEDYDEDGLTNLWEYYLGKNPEVKDAVLHVDDDAVDPQDGSVEHPFDTISKAVLAGAAVIKVAEGEYAEEISIVAMLVDIKGGYDASFDDEDRDPFTNVTTLTANDVADPEWRRPFTLINMNGGSIDGFTITGGDAVTGGGICMVNCNSTTISNNTIVDCKAGDGGAIACRDSRPVITNNIIGQESHGNTAYRNGGGIHCYRCPTGQITGNRICWNSSTGYGGGISCSSTSFLIEGDTFPVFSIFGNTICDNWSRAGGAAVNLEDCGAPDESVMVGNNVLAGNDAPSGGGIRMSMSEVSLINNTVADNSAADPD